MIEFDKLGKIISFSGTFTEIGEQVGNFYKARDIQQGSSSFDETTYEKQLGIYEKYYPELLDEYRSTAKAANYDEKEYIYRKICGELNWFKGWIKEGEGKACTIFGINNKNGSFVGRNYDWRPAAYDNFLVYKLVNPKTYSTFIVTDMEMTTDTDFDYRNLSPDDAINDQGLFIGLTFAYADKWSYGLSCVDVIRRVAETCRTIEEALEFFRNTPVCTPKNYFLADKYGNMAVVEHDSHEFRVIHPNNKYLIQTNHYLDKDLKTEDTVLKRAPNHNTFKRYAEVERKLISNPNIGFNDINSILCSTNCETLQNNRLQTCWSLSLDLTHSNYVLFYNLLTKPQKIKLEF